MPVTFNIRHLEDGTLYLKDELPVAELELETADELIHLGEDLSYDLQVQKLEKGILVQGSLQLTVQCDCARCLKPFGHTLVLDPWACHLALEGEEKAAVVNDCVDLTPYIREDILLAFPQHPLCEPECKGLSILQNQQETGAGREQESASATWAELNKLKF
jgi:uncharacterized protein